MKEWTIGLLGKNIYTLLVSYITFYYCIFACVKLILYCTVNELGHPLFADQDPRTIWLSCHNLHQMVVDGKKQETNFFSENCVTKRFPLLRAHFSVAWQRQYCYVCCRQKQVLSKVIEEMTKRFIYCSATFPLILCLCLQVTRPPNMGPLICFHTNLHRSSCRRQQWCLRLLGRECYEVSPLLHQWFGLKMKSCFYLPV